MKVFAPFRYPGAKLPNQAFPVDETHYGVRGARFEAVEFFANNLALCLHAGAQKASDRSYFNQRHRGKRDRRQTPHDRSERGREVHVLAELSDRRSANDQTTDGSYTFFFRPVFGWMLR